MKPSGLALRLSGVFLLSALLGLVITFLCVLIFKPINSSINQAYILLIWAILAYVINYHLSCRLLQKKEKQWKISLIEGELYKTFERGTFLKFYLGFVWRFFFLNAIYSHFYEKISSEENNNYIYSIVITSSILFLSYLWLLKFPYGNLSVRFNVVHKEIVPTYNEFEVVSETRKSESTSSAVMNIFTGIGTSSLMICYFLVGCIQFAAIFDFFHDAWNWWWIPSAIISGVLAYIPIIGGIAGIYSAYTIWNWPLLGAVLLFCWPIVIFIGVYAFAILADIYDRFIDSNK